MESERNRSYECKMHAPVIQGSSCSTVRVCGAVWQIGNCDCLETIQRIGLAMCVGVPRTAGLEAVAVEAGVKLWS